MWDADVWSEGSEDVFVGAMQAQAEAFARAVRGGTREGAGGDDAVAALTVASQVAESLAGAAARVRSAVGS
jgi:predicted dehydrogenase